METPQCNAIKSSGFTCDHKAKNGGHMCKLHANMFAKYGEQEMLYRAQKALASRQALSVRLHQSIWQKLNDLLVRTTRYGLGAVPVGHTIIGPPNADVREPFRTYFADMFPRLNEVVRQIYEVDRDHKPTIMAFVEQVRQELIAVQGIRGNGELAKFAADTQNVHTTAAVKQTKEIIDRVLKIAVPDEYKSPKTLTLTEVALAVDMPSLAFWQFAAKYCADEDIYDYGKGIYARVADAVWQFVKNSPDRTELCKIMSVELTDSMGVCLQGRLSRLCNVLAGYLDGINTESVGEQLQRRMAALMVLEAESDRLTQGKSVLQELAVPEAEWGAWLEALA
jgi:hypothetical protein